MARTRKGTSRRYRKRTRKMNISRPSLRANTKGQVYAFKRFVDKKANIVGNDAVPAGISAVTFQLNDVTQATEFTSLFDQYKIGGIQYRWVVSKDPMVATSKTFPRLVTVHDYDDNTPGNLNDLYQYPKMKEFWFTESRNATPWAFLKPARQSVEYESPTNSAYRPTWKGFIDCASPATPHYAIKYAWEALQTGMNIYLQCRYYLVFKNVR